MSRAEFSKATKLAAFQRAKGHCQRCTAKLRPGKIEYDHEIPCALGGDNSLDNCRCVCTGCHSDKTRTQDIPRIAKSNRVRAKHVGIKRRSSFQTNRDGLFKKKISGEVVRR